MRHRPQRQNGLSPSPPWRLGQPIALHSRRPAPSTSVTATTEKGVLDGPARSMASTSSQAPQYVTFRPPSRFIVTAQCVAAARPSGAPVAKIGAVVGASRAHRGSRQRRAARALDAIHRPFRGASGPASAPSRSLRAACTTLDLVQGASGARRGCLPQGNRGHSTCGKHAGNQGASY